MRSIDSVLFRISFTRQFARKRQLRWFFGCPEKLFYSRIRVYVLLTKAILGCLLLVLLVYHKQRLGADPALSNRALLHIFSDAIKSIVLLTSPALILLQVFFFHKSHGFCESPFEKTHLYQLMDSIRFHNRNLHIDLTVWVLAVSLLIVLAFGWLVFDIVTMLCIVLILLFASIYLINFTIRLPTALVLGSTNDNSLALQLKSEQIMYPLRVVSYIDPNNPGPNKYNALLDNMRTNHGDNSWIDSVRTMMDVVPLIVLDARYRSDSVVEEAAWASQARWAFKTVFVVGDDGQAPILHAVFRDRKLPVGHSARVLKEKGLGELLLSIREGSERLPRWDPDRDRWP